MLISYISIARFLTTTTVCVVKWLATLSILSLHASHFSGQEGRQHIHKSSIHLPGHMFCILVYTFSVLCPAVVIKQITHKIPFWFVLFLCCTDEKIQDLWSVLRRICVEQILVSMEWQPWNKTTVRSYAAVRKIRSLLLQCRTSQNQVDIKCKTAFLFCFLLETSFPLFLFYFFFLFCFKYN